MADVVERLPFPISKKLASTVTEIINRNGREIHYTVAGIPFRLALSPDVPMTIETAPSQKEQQDTELEAGEQTLSGWWLRSQSSWHEGAGARFSEAHGEVREGNQFWTSSNIDVWTPGEMRLLRRTVAVSASINQAVAVVPDATVFSVVAGQTGAVRRYTNLDAGTATTDLYLNGAVTFTQVLAGTTLWYAAGDNGTVYSGPIGSTTGTPTTWTLTAADTAKPTRICWAKHRLWAVNSNKIYELNIAAPGAMTAKYSHPSTSWDYTDVCDAPGGVLFSGHGDGSSHLQRITLNTDGSVPTLSAATTTAILPSDEKALRISSLTGSLVCILTNMGVRVAAVQTSGELVYGPLFMARTTELSATAKPSLTAAGRFWWLAWGDESKIWRLDSSTEVEEGVFAYASDMETASNVIGVAARNQRAVAALTSGALAHQHATELCSLGTIQAGRARFRTEEPKTYHFANITSAPLDGVVVLDVLDTADSETRVATFDAQGTAVPVSQIPSNLGPQRFMSVKLTLQRKTTNAALGPVIYGVLLRALPAPRPQRIYTLPFACYDAEQWSTGQREGYDGFARDRYLSVQAAEDAGGVVLLVDYGFPDPVGVLCHIEEMRFIQFHSPDAHQKDGGMGGILVVTLRTLT